MTVHEAAEAIAADLLGGREPPDAWAGRIETAILAWQDEALERVVDFIQHRYVRDFDRNWRAHLTEEIRSLKSPSVAPSREGEGR